jgi:hypothetical protein
MTIKAIPQLLTDLDATLVTNPTVKHNAAVMRGLMRDEIESIDAKFKEYSTIANLLLESLTAVPSIKYAYVLGSQGGLFKLVSGVPGDNVVHFSPTSAITNVNASTDVLTSGGTAPPDGTEILLFVDMIASTTPNMPGGLSEGVKYFTRDGSGSTFKVATTLGGTAVNITSTGNGTLKYSLYNLVWKRISGDTTYVTPENAGAVGDGSTDNTAAFADAANYCRRYGVGLRSHNQQAIYQCTSGIDLRQIDRIELHGTVRTALTGAAFCKIGGVSKYASFTASGTVMSATAHPFTNGDAVRVMTSGTAPTGLSTLTTYYIVSANTNDFGLATTPGGSAVNTTGAGSGTHWVGRNDNRFNGVYALTVQRLVSGNYKFDDTGAHGIEVSGVHKASLRLSALGYRKGIRIYSEYFILPCTYNTIEYGQVLYNYENVAIEGFRRSNTPFTDGWCKQCVHIGGNFSGGISTDGAATVPRAHCKFLCDGAWGVSEHTFYGPSFEGDYLSVVEYDVTAGAVNGNDNNAFYDFRLETGANRDIYMFKVTTGGGDTTPRANTVIMRAIDPSLGAGYSWVVDTREGQYGLDRPDIEVAGRRVSQRARFFCDLSGAYAAGGNIIYPHAPTHFDFATGKFNNSVNVAGTVTTSSASYDRSVPADQVPVHSSPYAPALRIRRYISHAQFYKLPQDREYTVFALGVRKTYTVDDTTDVFTCTGHGYADTNMVHLFTTSASPAGVAENTVYYIRDATANTFKLAATSGGSAINITSTGTGTQYIAKNLSTTGTDLRGRKGSVYNAMSYNVVGDWLWASKNVDTIIIGAAHPVYGGTETESFWIEETTIHPMVQLGQTFHMRLLTSNPSVTGAFWNDAGTVKVS